MTDPRFGKKWSCDYCTYENWPASKKCILCRAPKPPHLGLINEDVLATEQDIYKIAPLVQQTSTTASPTKTNPSDTGNKWSCHLCTYLNWPRSAKCTQCLTARRKTSPVASASSTQDQLQPLSINVNIAESPSSGPPSQKNSPNSPNRSPSSPEEAKEINNDKNKAKAVAARAAKWTCKACTYENWPKATKCVLCGTLRGKSYTDIQGACGGCNLHQDQPETNRRSSSRHRKSPPTIVKNSENLEIQQQGGATAASSIYSQEKSENNIVEERRLKQIRNRLRDTDWLWLNACQGVADGDTHAVEAYLTSGGDPARHLSQDEVLVLNRPGIFEIGYTLVHLAIRFQREDMLAVLLTSTEAAAKAVKRVPSHVCPDLAADLRREISASLRQRKGDFPCYFLTECVTFALPADIEDLPRPIQKQLFDELLDRDVQKELEVEEPIMNWSVEITERLGSRLYALWNRTAGDCLLDSVLQATWGVFDRDNTLRRALSDSLNEGAQTFFPLWKECETMQAQSLQFTLDETQWQQDWAILLSLASQPGASLEQTHIFALAHILRRPIIVYGVKFVKSFRGETIGYARFQGVYLPLLWEQSFCWKTPIALGYTRGHFSALVPMETDTDENIGAGANIQSNEDVQTAYLPLMDAEGKLLPVHFLTAAQLSRQESILREWLDCCVTDGGLLVAQMKLNKRPALVRQMVDEWLDRYRRLAHVLPSNHPHTASNLSSDGETDDE